MLIETQRLIIKEFKLDDLNQLAPIMADPEVMRYSLTGPHTSANTLNFIQSNIAACEKDGLAQHAVILKESQTLIGCCGFFKPIVNNIPEIELSYRIAQHYWGQGLGFEAAKACCDYAFNELKLNKVIAIIEPENVASIRVAEKCGLTFEQKILLHDIAVVIYCKKRQ